MFPRPLERMVGVDTTPRPLGARMNSYRIHHRSLAGSAALLLAGAAVVAGIAHRDTGSDAAHAAADRSVAVPANSVLAPAVPRPAGSGDAALRESRSSRAPARHAQNARGSGDPATSVKPESSATAIRIESEFKDPGELTDVQRARCGVAQPGICEAQLGGHSTLTGTMNGWTDYTTWGHPNADGSTSYYTYETFTGTVAGCGRGTFDFVVDDGRVDSGPSDQNPAARHLHGSWNPVPRSGTGDLTRLSAGHGQEDGLYYPDSSLSGAFTGDLTCGSSERADTVNPS